MKSWIELAAVSLNAGGFLPGVGHLLGMVAWKSIVLLALVCAAMALWRRGAAASRHLAWTAACLCLLLLPALIQCMPSWHGSAWAGPANINSLPGSIKFVWKDLAPAKSPATSVSSEGKSSPSTLGRTTSLAQPESAFSLWGRWVVAAWLAGLVVGLGRIAFTWLQLRRLARELAICENASLLKILENVRLEYHLGKPVKLLIAPANVAPMTWGVRQPIIVLPAEARKWSGERLMVVLRHELAHIWRGDCLTQQLAQIACAVYWFNPLVWLVARQMRLEREKACDDMVLNTGVRPSEYAGHLVDLASQFAAVGVPGAVAMARPSGLEQRVRAILDGRRRRTVKKLAATLIVSGVFGLGMLIGGSLAAATGGTGSQTAWSFQDPAVTAQLKQFVAEKEVQVNAATNEVPPSFKVFFAAAEQGDWLSVSNQFVDFRNHAQQYEHTNNEVTDIRLHGTAWEAVKEVWGGLAAFYEGNEKYSAAYGRDTVNAIPPGSIYFGGTDPGRFLITAWQKDQVHGDPFFTLTQNALADATYLDYLRIMYGDKIYIPTAADSQKCFQDYTEDAKQRLLEKKLKPGEGVKLDPATGRVAISGQAAVMAINGLIAKVIFDQNPNHEFFLEESFPLDWMYPYLEPHGLIFKINRSPLSSLPDEVVQQDHNYWARYIKPMIGDWLTDDTSVADITAFVQKTFGQDDLSGFTGDPQFVQSDWSCRMFSKNRDSIAGVYAWHASHDVDAADRKRMALAADFAFRQAWALCPYSSEATFRYAQLLQSQGRTNDALLVVETTLALPQMHQTHNHRDRDELEGLVKKLKSGQDLE